MDEIREKEKVLADAKVELAQLEGSTQQTYKGRKEMMALREKVEVELKTEAQSDVGFELEEVRKKIGAKPNNFEAMTF